MPNSLITSGARQEQGKGVKICEVCVMPRELCFSVFCGDHVLALQALRAVPEGQLCLWAFDGTQAGPWCGFAVHL